MSSISRRLATASLWLCLASLTGCSLFETEPVPPPKPALPSYDLVAAIRAAGEREHSIINVVPLRSPAVTALVDSAQRDEQARQYAAAAGKLDQALQLSPDAPDLLQDRAEAAVGLRDFALAERLALKSWTIGPRLGSLCARNRQTLVEIRLQAGDASGAAAARQDVQACHKAGIHRY